jgi:hypothetical protein
MIAEMSGSRVLRSGVGTQMLIASRSESTSKSVVASSSPSARSCATTSGRHIVDITAPGVDRSHPFSAGIETRHAQPGGAKHSSQRQTDIPDANDADMRRAIRNALQ